MRTGARLRQRLFDPRISLHSLELVDIEVLDVFRRFLKSGTVASARVAAAVERLAGLDLQRHRHGPILRRIWSWRDNLTAYDAACVTLAGVLGGPLLTTDGRLAKAPGPTVPVEVFATEDMHWPRAGRIDWRPGDSAGHRAARMPHHHAGLLLGRPGGNRHEPKDLRRRRPDGSDRP